MSTETVFRRKIYQDMLKWKEERDGETALLIEGARRIGKSTIVEEFAKNAHTRGIKVIIAAAGMAAHLPGVIAASTPLPVIGVPIKSSLDGMDALLAIVQMPPGIPVATVGINGALNAAILAVQMLALEDKALGAKFVTYKESLKKKIVQANEELKAIKYDFKTN